MKEIKNKILIIGGMPAGGKTSLSKRLCPKFKVPFLDKDLLFDDYTNYVTAKETFANDRHSPLYREVLRPLEYDLLWKAALTQADLGISSVLVAPFTTELQDKNLIKKFTKELSEVNKDFQLVTILVSAPPEDIKSRMIKRNRQEDKTKLADWDNYIQGKINFQKKASKIADLSVVNKNLEDSLNLVINYLKKLD